MSSTEHTYNIPVINTIVKNIPLYTNVTYESDATTLQFPGGSNFSSEREIHLHQPLQPSLSWGRQHRASSSGGRNQGTLRLAEISVSRVQAAGCKLLCFPNRDAGGPAPLLSP